MKQATKSIFAALAVMAAGMASAGILGGDSTLNAPVANATQGQQQGQAQGQVQGQAAIGVGVGGQAAAAGGNSVSSAQGGNATNALSLSIEATKEVAATSTAPALAVSNGTCMGSSSVGGQSVAVGLSLGTTWVDSGCDARYDSMALKALGLNSAAQARLCQKHEIAEAMKAAGTPCAKPEQPEAKPTASSVYTGNDPIVRARLGL